MKNHKMGPVKGGVQGPGDFFFLKESRVQKLGFPGRDPGPGRYREVREAYRIRFHLFASRFELGARSYVPKPRKANDS